MSTLRVVGYQDLMRAFARTDRETRQAMRQVLRDVGDVVRVDAVSRMAAEHTPSAAGYRTRVRQRGIAVEQSLKPTTGLHPEWGSWQMRHVLVPARRANAKRLYGDMGKAFDRIADHFNRGAV